MSVYLQYDIETSTKARVTLVHYDPSVLPQSMLDNGVTVSSIPTPSTPYGKIAVLYIDPTSNNLWFEYVNKKPSLEEMMMTDDEKYKMIDINNIPLADLQDAKMAQLDEACSNAIVNGFDATVNSNSYHFSCSVPAQANFQGTDTLFKDGEITQAEWTVIDNADLKTKRIVLSQAEFNAIKPLVYQHINSNVSKLRDTLQPQVEAATSNPEVDAINWT